jgi:hypothetical protein
MPRASMPTAELLALAIAGRSDGLTFKELSQRYRASRVRIRKLLRTVGLVAQKGEHRPTLVDVGMRFAGFEVVAHGERRARHAFVVARCDHGHSAEYRARSIRCGLARCVACSANTTSGRWWNTSPVDVGQTHGRWTVVGRAASRNGSRWECVCTCGRGAVVSGHALIRSRSRGCRSCARAATRKVRPVAPVPRAERAPRVRVKRGRTKRVRAPRHDGYGSWKEMWRRCTKPACKSYPRYGGKGISVCQRWKSFALFIEDLGPRPSPGHSLDRYPNQKGNYEPGNVRWATAREQAQNTSKNIVVEHAGERLVLSELARRYGLPHGVLNSRLRKGWPLPKALSTPKRNKRPNGTPKLKKAAPATAEVA